MIGPVWFVLCWMGYIIYAGRRAKMDESLFSITNEFRRRWMVQMLERDNRMVDASVLGNLVRSATFFASTTIFILAGLMALLGTADKAMNVVAGFPFAQQVTREVWELKILLMVLIFVYGFFKFTWALRQYNFLSVLTGAAPGRGAPESEKAAFVDSAARIASFAGQNFNSGLRAYYFSLAALTWFFHPVALVVATVWVVGILYWREFHSRTLRALKHAASPSEQ